MSEEKQSIEPRSTTPWAGSVCESFVSSNALGTVYLYVGYVTGYGYRWEADTDKGDIIAFGKAFSVADGETLAMQWATGQGFPPDTNGWGCTDIDTK
jgi:hypothetical protein